MDLIFLIILIIIAGICMGAGVHFIPVGGAPAAMATATGVGTGTAMLAAGAGMTGLITAASMEGASLVMIIIAGGIGAMLMMGITMLFANYIYVYGVGGGIAFYAIQTIASTSKVFGSNTSICIALAAICATGLFFINSVLASYNIGGTIEGMMDPKFKRIGRGAVCSLIASLVIAIVIILLCGGI